NHLFHSLASLTGYSSAPIYAPARAGEVFRIALDASRARSSLGWSPQMSLDDGLRATVDWIRQTMPSNATAVPFPPGRGLG
ncbi:MAG: putative UDP-glucose 4-epimerase, partial [Chloroflexi bacterium]|nr:putative UDP-glucose 4-epimerase [Chloroflexota bacterium]